MDQFNQSKGIPTGKPSFWSRLGRRAGELFFAFQRFCIKRLWTIIVLTLASQLGAFIAKREFGPEYEPWGRQGIYILLLGIGLMLFWIVPSRARFMPRLVWILLIAGAATLGITFLLALGAQDGSVGQAWEALDTYWMTPLGWQWLFGGVGLAAIMWGGLWLRSRVSSADRRKRQERAEQGRSERRSEPDKSESSSSRARRQDDDSRTITRPDAAKE